MNKDRVPYKQMQIRSMIRDTELQMNSEIEKAISKIRPTAIHGFEQILEYVNADQSLDSDYKLEMQKLLKKKIRAVKRRQDFRRR